MQEDLVGLAKRVFDLEMDALRIVRKQLNAAFEQAILVLEKTILANGKIVVTGVGKSGHIGRKIAATLTSTGAPSVVLDAVNAFHGDLGMVNRGDAVVALSYSGETEEILRLVPHLKRMTTSLIAITGNENSTLAKNSDLVLSVRIDREACPLNLAPTSSTTAMLVLGDALAMVLLEKRGFKKEDFARFHPGGTLGRNLLLKVGDIMRPLSQIVILEEEAKVKEALRLWNVKRVGAVVVVNPGGKVIGIFTHGDFVRNYEVNHRIGEEPLGKVMTKNPVTVRVDKLAVEVLNVFEHNKIEDLIVVDEQYRVVGLIDSQDLAIHRLL
ncbi:KpsF/GutQ family sugar-phosphate isomerase [Candidatus Methylacidiphilum infernorum]|uniref:Arabinose 5-phosphate isomerase and CBS domains n=1 Tax=Methylacidiphilum infernorum (isolate V4) TaxID=481448 RepID=B3E057_METI4|nr:KpsF/GutQ family sugar-phosphate isomerase [Candidatus Methylacidiphilum infernorum]ACD82718.1 Arabinose 5-phosphate isomerase and CBS domains [Methylacidiphilum infernorum V4]